MRVLLLDLAESGLHVLRVVMFHVGVGVVGEGGSGGVFLPHAFFRGWSGWSYAFFLHFQCCRKYLYV